MSIRALGQEGPIELVMKTILHIIDTTGPGGAETVFLELVKSAEKNGYKSIALIRGPGWVQSELERLSLRFFVIDCKGSMNFGYLRKLTQLIRVERVDIIQTHLLGSSVYGCLAGLICRRPVFCTFHGLVDIGRDERFKSLKLLALRLGGSKLITVTTRLQEVITSLRIVRKERIQTICNGIDMSLYQKVESVSVRSKLGVGEDLLIGSVGNIRIPKNYPLAIEAINTLHQQGVKVHYAIAGQGSTEQLKPVVSLVERYGLTEYVHVLGFVSDIQEFLSSLDIFLMSSSSEGHPLALTQAMANGLPIVSTPSGVEEIVDHEINALISAGHDSPSLAQCIKALYLDSGKAASLGENACSKAQELYSLEAMVGQYMNLYRGG